MAGKTLALVELMRPKNMVLAAITVPLGAHFGMNGEWNSDNALAVAVQIFTVLTFMGAGNAMNDIKDAAIDLVAHPARPLPSGRITENEAKRFVGILWLLSVASMLAGAFLLHSSDDAWWPLATIYVVAVVLMLTYDLGPETKT